MIFLLWVKGLIQLARKSETITEQILRMYKEGSSIEAIAKELGMPKDNVPKIIEKYMPDYESYTPPKGEKNSSEEKHKKTGFLNMPVGELFKKKNKNAEQETAEKVQEEPAKPAKSNINLTMNENGFVDGTVRGIASMLQNGKDVSTIADFFNRDEDDIIAVRACMNEHFERANSHNTTEKAEQGTSDSSQSKGVSGSYAGFTGLENIDSVNDTVDSTSGYNPPKYEAPDISNDDTSDEMPSIDTASMEELDKQLEALNKIQEEKAVENTEEIPSVETADMHMDTIINNTDTSNNEEDDSMTPMEKMKQFAQEQIDINNKKIDELKSKKSDVDNVTYEIDRKLETAAQQLKELEAKVLEMSKLTETLKEQKAKAGSAKGDIDAQIAEIEKENEEFKSYFK